MFTKRKNKLYRDNIYGDIELSPLAVDIIDTREFQRLDGIKQLGFTCYVYRGAKHTRFDHSIGVYHQARRILEQIRDNHTRFGLEPVTNGFGSSLGEDDNEKFDNLREIVGIAGLLHDISHVPHGHPLEDEIKGIYTKHDDIASLRLWHIMYEERSEISRLFDKEENYVPSISNNTLRDLIFLILKHESEEDQFEKIIKKARNDARSTESQSEIEEMLVLLQRKFREFSASDNTVFKPFMSDIIGNTVCADLLDYLRRDTRGTGLKIGVDPKIEKYFIVKKHITTKEDRLVIRLWSEKGLRLDITSAILDLLHTRYCLAERVYYHKTKVSADVMLGKLLQITGKPDDISPYPSDRRGNSPLSLFHWKGRNNSILTMTEEDLLEYIRLRILEMKENPGSAQEAERGLALLDRLKSRRLFKPLLIMPYYKKDTLEHTTRYEPIYDAFRGKEDEASTSIQDVEKEIDTFLGGNRVHALLFCPVYRPHAKEAMVCVEVGEDEIVPLVKIKADEKRIPESMKTRIESESNLYEHLWKFFVFIDSEDHKNEITRHVVILKLLDVLSERGISLTSKEIEDDHLSPGFAAPSTILSKWMETRTWGGGLKSDSHVCERIEVLAKDVKEWTKRCLEGMKSGISNLNELLDRLYADELKNFVNGKIREDETLTQGTHLPQIVANTDEILMAIDSFPVAERSSSTDPDLVNALKNLPHSGSLINAGLVRKIRRT